MNEAQWTVLKGNTHPLAQARFDQGAAPDSLPMNRMLLVLKRSPEQEASLNKLLDDQQDKNSAEYHKWLTPVQFGQQFGPSDQDIATITNWLQSYGFQIGSVSKGRTVIEFSGTAGEVQQAFHTAIHSYVVNGKQHWANASDPAIPTALVPAVAGVFTMHNFLKQPQLRILPEKIQAKYVPGAQPQTTFPGTPPVHALSPADYGTIYNINPVWDSAPSIKGSGETIAVVARSDLYENGQDVYDFENVFEDCCGDLRTILDGPDPGDLGGGEEAEVTLDATWSQAIAPNAYVDVVVSATTNTTDGVDLSELYIVDNDIADVMTESFGSCEADETSAEATGIESLAQQAAAEGITYLVSSGDNGAEGCDDPDTEVSASGPLSVNILASTPYDTAVGGTMFNENGQNNSYWAAANNFSTLESALSYIPEDVWNESCDIAACGQSAGIWAGSGGVSTFFSKPDWQSGVAGIPSDGFRDVPDVSLTAAGHDFYLLCLEGSCIPDSQGDIYLAGVSGTSASAPSFAGIMALVDQKMQGRQGQANYVLYRLAAAEDLSKCNASNTSALPDSSCIFNDVTVGNNTVDGEVGFGTNTGKYQSTTGYDLATGLGSVNAANLVNGWSSVTFRPTTTTLTLNSGNSVNIVHGSPVPIDITVAPNSGTGTPTGTVELLGSSSGYATAGSGVGLFTLANGSVSSGSASALPGGSYQVEAQYSGDATFAPSTSGVVSVTVTPEPSTTTVSAFTADQNGNAIPFSSGPYGSFLYLRADVAGKSGQGVATGSIQFNDNSNAIPGSWPLNSAGNTGTPQGILLAGGTHAITGSYSGDASFNTSVSTPISITINKAATTSTLQVTGANSSGTMLLASVNTTTFANAPTGTVTFMAGGSPLGNPIPVTGGINGADATAQATASGTFPLSGNQTLTASYSGDINYAASTSSPLSVSPDFLLTTTVPGSQLLVLPGGEGTATVTVTSVAGLSGSVSFACSGLPAESTCTFNPTSVALSSTSFSSTSTLTIQTTAATSSVALSGPFTGTAFLAFGVILLGGVFVTGGNSRLRKISVSLLGVALLAVLLPFAGCGGGGGGNGNNGHSDPGTPLGAYTVTVTATSGSLSHSSTFSLVVQ